MESLQLENAINIIREIGANVTYLREKYNKDWVALYKDIYFFSEQMP